MSAVQPADEGDYTVVITNVAGSVTSYSSRLWVAPPATMWIKTNFTNNLGRLPYFCFLPTNYTAARTYPLWLAFHGTPGDESMATTFPWPLAWVSYRQQQRDPVITVYPTRRVGDETWTDAYLRQVSALLDDLISRFSVDTNRIYVMGGSEGVHAAWDLMGMRPGVFAGAHLEAGWQGNSRAASIKDVPTWIFCARDDGLVGDTQLAVRALRLAGGNPIYTEYATGGHDFGIGMSCTTPLVIDWLLAQRRGVPSGIEPLLKITSPTDQDFLSTSGTNLSLSVVSPCLGSGRCARGVAELGQQPHGTGARNQRLDHHGPSPGIRPNEPHQRDRDHDQLGPIPRRHDHLQRHADGGVLPDPSHAGLAGNERGSELDWRRPALPDSTRHRFDRRGLDGCPFRRHSAADTAGDSPLRFLSHCWPIEQRASPTE